MLTHLLLGWVLDDATLFQNKWKSRNDSDDDDNDDGDNVELDLGTFLSNRGPPPIGQC